MDFGRQVGVENRAKIDSKRHRKSDEKKKVNLGRLGRVLGRFKRQKRSAVARVRALLWPGYPPISLKKGTLHAENLQTSTDHLPLDPDTQLGSFGPGADPTRSKAAYPPPRLRPGVENIDFWRSVNRKY